MRAGDYRDRTLADMTIECVEMWGSPEWEGTFHQYVLPFFFKTWQRQECLGSQLNQYPFHPTYRSGCISCSAEPEGTFKPYEEIAITLHGSRIGAVDISGTILYTAIRVQSPPSTHFNGVFNPRGGWVEAGRAMEVAIKRVGRMGGVIKTGWEVEGFVEEAGEIKGVRSKTGEVVEGDLVVVSVVRV